MAIISLTNLIICFGVIALYAFYQLRSKRNGRRLPPGPTGVPVLGNVNDLPKPGMLEAQHWLTHKDLYGACYLGQAQLES